MLCSSRLILLLLFANHSVNAAKTLQGVTLEVRLEAAFGTVALCETDTANAVKEAARACLVDCVGLFYFHTAECSSGTSPVSIFTNTIQLEGNVLGDEATISTSLLCVKDQIEGPQCVGEVQSRLPNVAGLEYVGGLPSSLSPTGTPFPPTSQPTKITLRPSSEKTLAPTANPTESPLALLLQPTATTTLVTTAQPTRTATFPSSSVGPTSRLVNPPTFGFGPFPTSLPQLRQTTVPTAAPSAALAERTAQPSTSTITLAPAVYTDVIVPPTTRPSPTQTPAAIFTSIEAIFPPSPTEPTTSLPAGEFMLTAGPSGSPRISDNVQKTTTTSDGVGNNESTVVVLLILLVITGGILFFLGLRAVLKQRSSDNKRRAKRIKEMTTTGFLDAGPKPLSRSRKGRKEGASETEQDCLSSVSSFHPSDYSSSSSEDSDDEDDVKWDMFSVMSGVTSAGRVSFVGV